MRNCARNLRKQPVHRLPPWHLKSADTPNASAARLVAALHRRTEIMPDAGFSRTRDTRAGIARERVKGWAGTTTQVIGVSVLLRVNMTIGHGLSFGEPSCWIHCFKGDVVVTRQRNTVPLLQFAQPQAKYDSTLRR